MEENYIGKNLGAKLLEHGRIEAAKLGYNKLYICTDLVGYYEKYGWVYIGKGFHPWGAESRIYEHEIIPINEADNIICEANIEDFKDILALQKLSYQSDAEIYGDYNIPLKGWKNENNKFGKPNKQYFFNQTTRRLFVDRYGI